MADEQDDERQFDPDRRVAPCPDQDAQEGLSEIKLTFAIPVSVTLEQYRRLCQLVDEIASAPWNTPEAGVHWFSFQGSEPLWSKADAAFLGLEARPDAPDGGEPGTDDSVLLLGTTARAFGSAKERERALRERRGGTDG